MLKKILFYHSVYTRFGSMALIFLVKSKLLKNKLSNRGIKGIKYPVQLSNYSTDVTTLFQIFFAKEYEIRDDIEPDSIIDCGANIGFSAVWYANKYPTARIIAIEPDLNNFGWLKKNAECYPNIICINRAIWPYHQLLEIVDQGTGNWSIQTRVSEKSSGQLIETISIDNIISKFDLTEIDILKIDIEGAEKELFRDNYQNWLGKTKVIAIELHDNIDADISKIFFSALSDKNYKKYHNGENLICDFR